jgi:hypothetical protein
LKRSNFQLEKTYLDCIDQEENCFIIYRAAIKIFFLKLNYSALIFSDKNGMIEEVSSFKKAVLPIIKDDLKFASPQLQVSGGWTRTDNPIKVVLYKDRRGRELVWNCHHPKSNALVIYKNNNFSGLGYAETISLPFFPRQLPIDELRWGRFLSQQHTIIWIYWKGARPLNKIFYNGQLFEDGLYEEDGIIFGNGYYVLKFGAVHLVTKRKLFTLFTAKPFLKLFFSDKILNTEENKYKAHSTFTASGISDKGFSLFEIVTWKK